MTIDIRVPVLPESVADATVATWHKKPGESVKRDESLVDIETDKVVLEVVAPEDGTLQTIIKAEGSVVKAQEVIAHFIPGAAAAVEAPKSAPVSAATPPTPPVVPAAAPVSAAQPAARFGASQPVTPAGGPAARRQQMAGEAPALSSNVSVVSASPALSVAEMGAERPEKRVPMTRLRARVAERLVQAQQTAAILTTFNEVNMKPVMDLRNKYKEAFEKAHGIKLGFMSFFARAVVEALKRFPVVNASIDGQDIVYHGYIDLGVAVSTERGLVVPVLRNAGNMSLAELEKGIAQLGLKAKNNQLSVEDMTGGTFTVSNGGVFGSLMSTPIINPPQTGILGMHKIQERPVAENGQVVIRPMMYLALSYDHRLIDGSESVRFLVTIKDLLEDPARLLLDV